MQPLAQRLEREDELAAVRDRGQHGLDAGGSRPAAGTLARQPDQRRAVAIIGLKSSRPELCPGCLRLRRSEHPQRPRPAPLQLGRPRPMQRPRRLDREHRRPHRANQPAQALDALARRRHRHRLADQPVSRRHPHPIDRLAGIDRHDHAVKRNSLEQPVHRTTPSR